MINSYISFNAQIKKLKFETDEGIKYPGTALIQFQLDDREKPVVELMGYIEEKEIYNAIDRGDTLNLDHCYIEKFSLRDYRLTRNLDSRAKVVLKGFTARHSLFGGLSSLDFSHAIFEGDQFSLEHAWVSREDVTFESARFKTNEVSFHNTRLPEGNFNFKNVTLESAETSFKNCNFGKGDKDFQYASFGSGSLSFINAEFSDGNVNFINTNFGRGNVSFKVARFGEGRVDFHFATFKSGNVSFERTEFGNGKVDFRTVEFGSGRINFNRAVFGNGEVNFNECEMEKGKFSFKRAVFGSGNISFEEVMFEHIDVSFEHTNFGDGEISFYKSWFNTLSFGFCHLNGFLDLKVSQSDFIDLSNTVVRDIIDLNPHEFKASINTVSFAGMRLIGRIYMDWRQNEVKNIIHSQERSSHRIKAEQFRILKENFKNLGLYDDEDRAYVEFRRSESKAELSKSKSRSRVGGILHYPVYLFKLALFDKAGLYATSPVRVLLTMFTFFLFFSLLYFVLMMGTSADIIASVDDQLSMIERSFYHSAITFLTIGYGDHYPFGSIRWVSSIEGFFGLFLMSYFTVAFVRKVLR